MAEPSFEAAVRGLFESLRLGIPRFDDTGVVRLRVDDLAVNLASDGRGGIAIDGRAGALSADPRRRAAQVRDILRANAGFLLANEAGTRIEAGPGAGVESVVVRASHRPDVSPARTLADAIDDVLALIEHHRAALARLEGTRVPPIAGGGRDGALDEAIIFRP